jgi:hypothetical protein
VKKRVIGLVVAVLVAASLGLGAAPASAQTAGPRPASSDTVVRPAVDPGTIITIIKGAYDIYKAFTSGGSSGQAATNQILAAINSARTDIINHIDAIATAQARACAQEVVIDFDSFEALTTDNKQAFALGATSCLTLINSLQSAVTDKPSLDQLGFTLDFVGPIVLIVRARTGLSNTGITPTLLQGNQQTLSVMAPSCHGFVQEGHTQWICTAYNGDVGGAEPSLSLAQREAGARTSWAMARAVLPTIQAL